MRRLMGGLGLSLLAVGTAALCIFALRQTPAPAAAESTLKPAQTHAKPSGGPSPKPSQTPQAAPTAAAGGPLETGLLADVFGTTAAWVTDAGTCQTGERSALVWGDKDASLPVAHVLRLKLTGAKAGWVVGAEDDCTPLLYSTSNAGSSWTKGSPVDATWYLDPDGKVHAPSAAGTDACTTTLGLAAATKTAAVAWCSEGLYSTSDGAKTWKPMQGVLGEVVAVELLRAGEPRLAARNIEDCDGVAVLEPDSTHWRTVGCVAAASAGAVALSFDGSSGVLVVGSRAWRSTDSGQSWRDAAPRT